MVPRSRARLRSAGSRPWFIVVSGWRSPFSARRAAATAWSSASRLGAGDPRAARSDGHSVPALGFRRHAVEALRAILVGIASRRPSSSRSGTCSGPTRTAPPCWRSSAIPHPGPAGDRVLPRRRGGARPCVRPVPRRRPCPHALRAGAPVLPCEAEAPGSLDGGSFTERAAIVTARASGSRSPELIVRLLMGMVRYHFGGRARPRRSSRRRAPSSTAWRRPGTSPSSTSTPRSPSPRSPRQSARRAAPRPRRASRPSAPSPRTARRTSPTRWRSARASWRAPRATRERRSSPSAGRPRARRRAGSRATRGSRTSCSRGACARWAERRRPRDTWTRSARRTGAGGRGQVARLE